MANSVTSQFARSVFTIGAFFLFQSVSLDCLGQTCVPSPIGLGGWWRAESDASDSANSAVGALFNGAGFTTGHVGQAFQFDGVDDHVRIDNWIGLQLTNRMTIEAWIYPTSHDNHHIIVAKWDLFPGVNQRSFSFSLVPSGQLSLGLSSNGEDSISAGVASSSVVPLNQWSHVCGTYDGTSMKIYLNGVFEAQTPFVTGIFPGTTPVGIGGLIGGGAPGQAGYTFAGSVDEVGIYNRALSDPEIISLFDAGSAGRCLTQNAPSIITQPTNQNFMVGDNVSFNVVADGSSPLSFQWQFNGTNLNGATGTLLTITNVQLTHAGTYSVIVTNSVAAVTSSPAILSVGIPPCVPLPSNAVGWWRANADAEDVVGGAGGILFNGASYTNGKVGLTFSFDGVNDHVRIADWIGLHMTNALAIEAWIYPTSHGANHIVAARWDLVVGPNQRSYVFSLLPSGHVSLGLSSNGADFVSASAASTNVIPLNQWSHVCGTYDGTSIKISVNGGFQAETTYSGGIFPGSNDLGIGGLVGNGLPGQVQYTFAGRIDEVGVYNRALSPSEIQATYAAGVSGKCFVLQPPTIATHPVSQTVNVSNNVSLQVVTTGTSPFSYQWKLNGVNLTDETNAVLSVADAQPSTAGIYSVAMTNAGGFALSLGATLKVKTLSVLADGLPLNSGNYSFTSPALVAIQSLYANGLIFYTLDGTAPTFQSAYYNSPFLISQNATLRAIVYRADFFEVGELDPITLSFPPAYSLVISNAGGGVVSAAPAPGPYFSNTVVNLMATPNPGWVFLQWLGDASGSSLATNISMTRPKSVRAVFETTLNATAAGGGAVTFNPSGGIYPYGTPVQVSGVPQAGKYFALWGNAASGNVNPFHFVVTNANPTISSLFSTVGGGQSALTVAPVGHGKIAVTPRANVYSTGSGITVTATPDVGQAFIGWSGDATGAQNPLITSVQSNRIIFANFTKRAKLVLTSSESPPNELKLAATGQPGEVYQLDTSTNLIHWLPLVNLTNRSGVTEFIDGSVTNFKARFYRATTMP